MIKAINALRVMELFDRAAISDTIGRLGVCLDEHRFDELSDLLVEKVTASTPGGVAEGKEAVIAQATRNHARYTHLQHVISPPLIELDGDRASARTNFIATFANDSRRPLLRLGAVYRFELRRLGDAWKIAGLTVSPSWRQDLA